MSQYEERTVDIFSTDVKDEVTSYPFGPVFMGSGWVMRY